MEKLKDLEWESLVEFNKRFKWHDAMDLELDVKKFLAGKVLVKIENRFGSRVSSEEILQHLESHLRNSVSKLQKELKWHMTASSGEEAIT